MGLMQSFLNGPGFLGTHAPLISDLSLVLTLITAGMFTVGWQLARQGHYTIHRWVQTGAATLNAIVVVAFMITSFVRHILPGIPGKLLQGDYGVTTVHALVGTFGLLLGIFIVIRANELGPRALRFTNYKLFMRTSYALYMLATALGAVVYLLVYVLGI
jgi:uncharacterized membrane protein YozB (DUF420 family)